MGDFCLSLIELSQVLPHTPWTNGHRSKGKVKGRSFKIPGNIQSFCPYRAHCWLRCIPRVLPWARSFCPLPFPSAGDRWFRACGANIASTLYLSVRRSAGLLRSRRIFFDLLFFCPTDFTDLHRFRPVRSMGWRRFFPLGVPPDLESGVKKCSNLFRLCGFAIRSKGVCFSPYWSYIQQPNIV